MSIAGRTPNLGRLRGRPWAAALAAFVLLAALGAAATATLSPFAAAQTPQETAADPYLGFNFPSWLRDEYAGETSDASLAALRDTGANAVSIVVTHYMAACTDNDIFPSTTLTPSDDAVAHAIETARGQGLAVVLKPHVDLLGAPACFRGSIQPADPAAWFSAYTDFITHYARLAQTHGVDLFIVGTEFVSISPFTDDWAAVIAAVRADFDGPLTYAANWDECAAVDFWDALDYIGIDAYFPLSLDGDPGLDSLRDAWTSFTGSAGPPDGIGGAHDWLAEIDAVRSAWGKEVLLTEVGLRSVVGSAAAPYDCGLDGPADEALQARAYSATLDVWRDVPWFRGLLWWAWMPDAAGDGCTAEFSPQGKIAARVFTAAVDLSAAPDADAGPDQSVLSGDTVRLDARASTGPNANPLTYAWTQAGGPSVTLSGASTPRPSFTAPLVTQDTALTFRLVVDDGEQPSAPAIVVVTVLVGRGLDLTALGAVTARVTQPRSSVEVDIERIRDGDRPPVGSADAARQYDSYDGFDAAGEDWIGYVYAADHSFTRLVFQEGLHFWDGGWFDSLTVHVRRDGLWTEVTGLSVSPAYPGEPGASFQTYVLSFDPVLGDGIRLHGAPGGFADFISVAELQVFGDAASRLGPNHQPAADAGPDQEVGPGASVTLTGALSADPDGDALTYAWTQTAGPTVTLSDAAGPDPAFTAPAVTEDTTLVFRLVVHDGELDSAPDTVLVTLRLPS